MKTPLHHDRSEALARHERRYMNRFGPDETSIYYTDKDLVKVFCSSGHAGGDTTVYTQKRTLR